MSITVKIPSAITEYGFVFGPLRCERLCSTPNGCVVVRITNIVNGQTVTVTTSPKGRKQYVQCANS